MLNTAKLRGKFAERDLPLYKGAQCLGISERAFYSKMRNGKLGCDDAKKLATLLEIRSHDELIDIFLS